MHFNIFARNNVIFAWFRYEESQKVSKETGSSGTSERRRQEEEQRKERRFDEEGKSKRRSGNRGDKTKIGGGELR